MRDRVIVRRRKVIHMYYVCLLEYRFNNNTDGNHHCMFIPAGISHLHHIFICRVRANIGYKMGTNSFVHMWPCWLSVHCALRQNMFHYYVYALWHCMFHVSMIQRHARMCSPLCVGASYFCMYNIWTRMLFCCTIHDILMHREFDWPRCHFRIANVTTCSSTRT